MTTIIGIGVNGIDDFSAFGQEVVETVEQAQTVIALSKSGDAVDLRTGEEVPVYIYDDSESALFECCERIKTAWEEDEHSETHLGHAAAGMWLFYWVAPDFSSIRQLVREGRLDDLRAAVDDYISSGFGARRGPNIAEQTA